MWSGKFNSQNQKTKYHKQLIYLLAKGSQNQLSAVNALLVKILLTQFGCKSIKYFDTQGVFY